MFRSLLALAALAALGARLPADVLILANDDVLTGTFTREQDGLIIFQSDILGEIRVPVEKARVEIQAPEPEPAPPAAAPVSATQVAEAPAQQQKPAAKKPNASYKFKPLDLRTAAKDPKQAERAERTGWIRRLEFGFTDQSGRVDKSDLSIALEAGRRGEKSEARVFTRYLAGESNQRKTADLLEGNLRLRRNLSERMFAQSSTRVSRDRIKRIDLDGEQGLGLGRNLIYTDQMVLALGAGAAARYRDEISLPPDWDYLIDGFQDFRYEINSRFSIVQDLSLVVAPANDNDYKLRLNAALTGKVTESLNMSMRYEYEYDRSLALMLRDNQRIVTAVVYVF